jgi:phytoene synthase
MTLTYCGTIVRQHDPDRFLLGLLCPAEKRESLWALFAFNYEIAKTRDVVSETSTGLIRLQWWREAVGQIYAGGAAPDHAVIAPLSDAVRRYALPAKEFEGLIYAREFDVEDRAPATMEGLHNYAEFTAAPLNALALKVLGHKEEADALRAVSITYAVTGLMRALPHHMRQRRCFLPEDRMLAHKATVTQVYDFNRHDALRPVVKDVMDGLSAFKAQPESPFLRVQAAIAAMWAARIAHCGYDLYDPRMGVLPPFYALRALLASKGVGV